MNPDPIARLVCDASALRAMRFTYARAHDWWKDAADELWRAGEKAEAKAAQVEADWLRFVYVGESA